MITTSWKIFGSKKIKHLWTSYRNRQNTDQLVRWMWHISYWITWIMDRGPPLVFRIIHITTVFAMYHSVFWRKMFRTLVIFIKKAFFIRMLFSITQKASQNFLCWKTKSLGTFILDMDFLLKMMATHWWGCVFNLSFRISVKKLVNSSNRKEGRGFDTIRLSTDLGKLQKIKETFFLNYSRDKKSNHPGKSLYWGMVWYQVVNQRWTCSLKYRGDLNTKLVWYSNGWQQFNCWMVRYSSQGLNIKLHFVR